MKEKIIRNAAFCLNCKTYIESERRHDFQSCNCQRIFVDGGHDYLRSGGDPDFFVDMSIVEKERRKPQQEIRGNKYSFRLCDKEKEEVGRFLLQHSEFLSLSQLVRVAVFGFMRLYGGLYKDE